MMQFLNFETQPCEEDDAEFFHEKIDEISDSIVPPMEGAEDEYIFLKITDDEDNVIGGCIVETDSWKIAELDVLWVDEKQRNRGIGTYLLSDFEREAKANGAYMVILDALDWQMPFFEKHGYTVCGTLEDCPKGHRWCQMQKLL